MMILLGMTVRGPDKWASQGGAYHAARSTAGRPRFHEGIDFLTVPGQEILAPKTCWYERSADPYDDKKDAILSGMVLRFMDNSKMKILYVKPDPSINVGASLVKGAVIGHAQSLQHLYEGIQNHIHVEWYTPSGERVDPTGYVMDTA